MRVCTSAPPSSSGVTTSPIAAFTSGGPPRKIVAWFLTMIDSSDIAGTYAPPAVREDVVLLGQERAARIDEVDARQPVLDRDLLAAQVLLHRHRVVGAALHRR